MIDLLGIWNDPQSTAKYQEAITLNQQALEDSKVEHAKKLKDHRIQSYDEHMTLVSRLNKLTDAFEAEKLELQEYKDRGFGRSLRIYW